MNKATDGTPLDAAFVVSRNASEFARFYHSEIEATMAKMDLEKIGELVALFDDCRKIDGTIYFCGNGGKAALCAEWVNDITVALPDSKFRAHSLMDNLPGLTAAANDYSYETALWQIFHPMGRPGDILVGLSGSGWSDNVMYAIDKCRSLGVKTVGVGRGGRLADLVDLHIEIPTMDDGPTEDGIMILLHIVHAWFVRSDDDPGRPVPHHGSGP